MADLIQNLELPKTRGRLATSIQWKVAIDLFPFLGANNAQLAQLAGGVGTLQGLAQQINASFGQNVVDLGGITYTIIGGLQHVQVVNKRTGNKRRRGLGRTSQQAFQVVPGFLEPTIRAKIVEFYNLQQVGNLLGLPPNSLLHQQLGLSLLREKRDPSGQLLDTIIYSDCWFEEDSWIEDLSSSNADQLIVHDVVFTVGPIFVVDSTGAGRGPEIDVDAAISLVNAGIAKGGEYLDSLQDFKPPV